MTEVSVVELGKIGYQEAWQLQKDLFQQRRFNHISDLILICEHPHTITLGKSGAEQNLLLNSDELNSEQIDFVKVDRGGDITYHGPGQLVAYPILNLNDYFRDVHKYMRLLEEVVIHMLEDYAITAERIDGLTGVWVNQSKICAMGVKISRWITMHGLAFNVCADLTYFNKIIPCGISDKSVCNLSDLLRKPIQIKEVSDKLINSFKTIFEMNCSWVNKAKLYELSE